MPRVEAGLSGDTEGTLLWWAPLVGKRKVKKAAFFSIFPQNCLCLLESRGPKRFKHLQSADYVMVWGQSPGGRSKAGCWRAWSSPAALREGGRSPLNPPGRVGLGRQSREPGQHLLGFSAELPCFQLGCRCWEPLCRKWGRCDVQMRGEDKRLWEMSRRMRRQNA